jgi:hypothetical protein
VSNTDNVNILYEYLMYMLTDCRLILKKDTKDKPDFSSERADPSGTALARTSSNSKLQNRPLVREGVTNNKPQLSKIKSQGERKIGHGSQMGA